MSPVIDKCIKSAFRNTNLITYQIAIDNLKNTLKTTLYKTNIFIKTKTKILTLLVVGKYLTSSNINLTKPI